MTCLYKARDTSGELALGTSQLKKVATGFGRRGNSEITRHKKQQEGHGQAGHICDGAKEPVLVCGSVHI